MSKEKLVGETWTWLTDYVYAWATWTLNIEKGRECEVGMGIKAFGSPRGERRKFRNSRSNGVRAFDVTPPAQSSTGPSMGNRPSRIQSGPPLKRGTAFSE